MEPHSDSLLKVSINISSICIESFASYVVCDGSTDTDGYIRTASNELTYPIKSNISITCIAFNAVHNQPPNWFFKSFYEARPTRIPTLKPGPSYSIRYRYNDRKCLWNSTLIISNFSLSLSGSYYCSYGLNKVHSLDIDLKGKHIIYIISALTTIIPFVTQLHSVSEAKQ